MISSFLASIFSSPLEGFPGPSWNPQLVIREISFSSTSGLDVFLTFLLWLKADSPWGHGFSQIDGCLHYLWISGPESRTHVIAFQSQPAEHSLPLQKTICPPVFNSLTLWLRHPLIPLLTSEQFLLHVTLSIIFGDFIATEVSFPHLPQVPLLSCHAGSPSLPQPLTIMPSTLLVPWISTSYSQIAVIFLVHSFLDSQLRVFNLYHLFTAFTSYLLLCPAWILEPLWHWFLMTHLRLSWSSISLSYPFSKQ